MDRVTTDIELVTAYLNYFKSRDKELSWSWERVDELLRADPDNGWALTLKLLAAASDDAALAYVAAGPLEDLLNWHGVAVIDRVEAHARKDARFRLALTRVWGRGAIFDRVHRAADAGSNHPLERTRS
jgi:hypothetical protein